jgi:hypothetical protein
MTPFMSWYLACLYGRSFRDAQRGVPPDACKCESLLDLADWFALFAVAAGARCPTR